MKLIKILLLLLMVSCTSAKTDTETVAREVLGPEKTKALNILYRSFGDFIELNYSHEENQKQKYLRFLNDFKYFFENGSFKDTLDPKEHWTFDVANIIAMAEIMESSEMRQEIMYYPLSYYTEQQSEEDEKRKRTFRNGMDSIQYVRDSITLVFQDNPPHFNHLGLLIKFLSSAYPDDTCFNQYIDYKLSDNRMSPEIEAQGAIYLVQNDMCPNSEFLSVFLAVDFYYYRLVDLLIKREKYDTLKTDDTP